MKRANDKIICHTLALFRFARICTHTETRLGRTSNCSGGVTVVEALLEESLAVR